MHHGTVAVAVSITFTALAGIVVSLRCISRFIVVRRIGADDIFAILAYLSSIATTCLIYAQYKHGLGQDIKSVGYTEMFLMLKYLWGMIITFGLGMTFLGISALAQYLRFLFQRSTRILCWTLIAAIAMFGVAALFIDIFTCQPVSFAWNKFILGGKCIDFLVWWYFSATFIIIMSFILTIIPLFAIKDLTLARGQKIALIGVFALGGFECLISILRLFYIYTAATSKNFTKDTAECSYWSSLDMNVGIICISIPPLKALYTSIRPSLRRDDPENNLSQCSTITPAISHTQPASPATSDEPTNKRSLDPWAIP